MTGAQLGLDFEAPRLVRVTPPGSDVGRLPPPLPAHLPRPARAAVRTGARAASTLGAVVHLALRSLFALPPARRTPEAAARLVDRHWNSEGFRDAEQAHRYRERAPGLAGRVRRGRRPRSTPSGWSSGCRWRSAGSSRRAGSTGSTGGATSWSSSTTRPGARPDRLGRPRSRALALYALGVERTLRRRCVEVELHHCRAGTSRGGGTTGVAGRARRGGGTLGGRAGRRGRDLEAGATPRRLPARPAPRCGSCDVRRHCPEGRAAAPESEPWAS